MFSAVMVAQEGPGKRGGERMMNATPEEMAQMQTKRLTLALVLDDAQQKKVYNLELEQAKKFKTKMEERKAAKESGEKPTEEERKAMYGAMIDAQIAHQEKMQDILTKEQFDQWRKMRSHRKMAGGDKGKERGKDRGHRDKRN